MRVKAESVAMIILLLCALLTTGVVLQRYFLGSSAAAEFQAKYIDSWRMDAKAGLLIGASNAKVQLLEFADFECPFCGSFHKALKSLEQKYPKQLALTFVHFPLPGHRFAMPAARVAGCAGEQGRFEAMHEQLFEGQDQFGLKPWDDYATAAGVPDLATFDVCIKRTDPISRVEEGKALGAKWDVKGTPTIIINGWKLARPPTEGELDQMVQRILAGKPPVDAKSSSQD